MGVGEYEQSVTQVTMDDLQAAFGRFVIDQPEIIRAAAKTAAHAPVLPPPAYHHFQHIDPASYQRVAEDMNQHVERPFQPADGVKQLVAFDQIKAPTLKQPDLAEIKTFWLKYEKYERDLAEKFDQYDQQFAIQYRHVRNCMEPYVFNTICRFRWKHDPATISHVDVYALIKTDCQGSHAQIQAFQSRVKAELKIDETIKEGASRVLCLVTLYEKICTECGFPGYAEAEIDASRRHIIGALKPEAVKSLVQAEVNFSKRRYNCWDDFVGLLIERMNAYCTYESAFKAQVHAKDDVPKGGGKPEAGRGGRKGGRGQPRQQDPPSPSESQAGHNPDGDAVERKKSKFPCLKCNSEYHLVWHCPNLRDESKAKQLLGDWKKAQALAAGQKPAPKPRTSAVTTATQQPDSILATLAGSVGFPVRCTLDSGADVTVVTRGWVDRALASRCEVEVQTMDEPITTLAFNGAEFLLKQYVLLDISLPIAAGGILLLRKLPCLIADGELPSGCSDLLVSRHVMATLGFDATAILHKAGAIKRVWDFEPHVDPTTGKLRIGRLHVPEPDYGGHDGLEMCLPSPGPLVDQMEQVQELRK
ncbi:hypothetical protein ACHHYP_05965 [Achlya hypogyna]|uniref:Peptidase A2 domain-containing protein n=1 Tax=Achlya hypogyna TaxID=1202772 RepID=A0A1V9ZNC6_ACHHY|nr:hypothetical protein ACHHYP_05965 [Achlya hypogyna]